MLLSRVPKVLSPPRRLASRVTLMVTLGPVTLVLTVVRPALSLFTRPLNRLIRCRSPCWVCRALPSRRQESRLADRPVPVLGRARRLSPIRRARQLLQPFLQRATLRVATHRTLAVIRPKKQWLRETNRIALLNLPTVALKILWSLTLKRPAGLLRTKKPTGTNESPASLRCVPLLFESVSIGPQMLLLINRKSFRSE